MSYKLKYLKYKKKYLNLKNSKINGGKIKNNLVVHKENKLNDKVAEGRSEFSSSLRNYLKDLKTNVFDVVNECDINTGVLWPEVNDESYTVKSDLFYNHISYSEINNILFYALYLLCIENVEEDSIWENIIFPVSEIDPVDCFVDSNLVGDDYEKGQFFKDLVQIKNFKNELPSDPTDFIDVLDNFMNTNQISN